MEVYRLADPLRWGEKFTYAVATGEFRPPRQGEWYLSGAIPAAYRAPNDLSTPYWIAEVK
jgi:hypothetical protein